MRLNGTRRFWTEADDQIMIEKYPDTENEVLMQLFNRSLSSIYGRALHLKLKKKKEFLKNLQGIKNLALGAGHRFVKGQPAHNKGKKMNKETYEKVKKSFFKKGHMPHNARQDEYETLRVDGYWYVRISPQKFELKQKVVWQNANGPIPEKMVLTFKDGNPANCELSNLMLITMKENMLRNSIQNYPPEIKSTIQLLSKLNRKINEKQNDRPKESPFCHA